MSKQLFVANTILTAAQLNTLQTNDFNQTVSTKTANYVLVAADAGTKIVMNAAGATTITVNTSLFAAGDNLTIANIGAGVCTVTAGTATVSSAGPLAIPQYGGGTLYFTSAGVSTFFGAAGPAASSGLTLITSGSISNTTSVNNCFSATYQNYKIVLNSYVGPAADTVRFRLRVGGADNSAANYSALGITCNLNTGTLSASTQKNATFWSISQSNDMANGLSTSWDLLNPFEAKNTNYTPLTFFYGDLTESFLASGIHVSATSFDGFTIFPNSGTLTGTYKVYGYSS
jgi:hypothetical protein